jgi:hypothetical protein
MGEFIVVNDALIRPSGVVSIPFMTKSNDLTQNVHRFLKMFA